jgi:adenylosuccinate synthase
MSYGPNDVSYLDDVYIGGNRLSGYLDGRNNFVEFKGWNTDMTKFTSEDQFPQEFNDYVKFLEEYLETPIRIISIGPDRAQTIVRK